MMLSGSLLLVAVAVLSLWKLRNDIGRLAAPRHLRSTKHATLTKAALRIDSSAEPSQDVSATVANQMTELNDAALQAKAASLGPAQEPLEEDVERPVQLVLEPPTELDEPSAKSEAPSLGTLPPRTLDMD